MLKVWNLVLVILTFFFTIFGTFMTRSGIVQSVHAFGQDSVLALQFVCFMAFLMVVSIGLLVHRLPRLRKDGALAISYASTQTVESLLERVKAAGVSIRDLKTEEPDLEDVFVSMTSAPRPETVAG